MSDKTALVYVETSELCGTPETRTVMIEENIADIDTYTLRDKFIVPLLLGIGYAEKTVNDILAGDEYVTEGDE